MAWEQWPTENIGRPRGATQIPPLRYAPVGMTILFGDAQWSFRDGVGTMGHGEFGKAERRNADPSTTLRSGRDDNFVWERSVEFPRWRGNNGPRRIWEGREAQRRSLHYATLRSG